LSQHKSKHHKQHKGIPNSPYVDPKYSAKFDGNGKYSPQWVEDFTDSTKFDNGVGGGIDQDNSPFKKQGEAYAYNGGSNPATATSLHQKSSTPHREYQWHEI
jgi:hypothetical protein